MQVQYKNCKTFQAGIFIRKDSRTSLVWEVYMWGSNLKNVSQKKYENSLNDQIEYVEYAQKMFRISFNYIYTFQCVDHRTWCGVDRLLNELRFVK